MNSSIRLLVSAVTLAVLAGCATQHNRAPVVDRGRSGSGSASTAPSVPKAPPPGAENAGKPGYYTVVKGDTLIRIALEAGQNYKEIAAWNNLENPNMIEVGQVLRVAPPVAEGASSNTLPAAKPISVPKVEAKGLDGKSSDSKQAASPSSSASKTGPVAAASAAASASSPTSSANAAPAPEPVRDTADEPAFIWPNNGPVIGAYEEGKRKGVAIGGKEGDPVLAAADGRVVYAGSGLRGYGNLIIIKHNGDYLTAYAHNKALLVKEDQAVKKGQKIAEMGATDSDRVQLHFELRKQGKPIDPTKQLPAR